MFKKSKIKAYLSEKQSAGTLNAFDTLLLECINGTLAQKLSDTGITDTEIHIDWLPEYKCINVSGSFQEYAVEIQIEPHGYTVAADPDEPDEYKENPLVSAGAFYEEIKRMISEVKK